MLPTVGRIASPEAVLGIARHAEDLGAGSLWVSDHLAMPVHQESRLPHSDQVTYPVPLDRNYLEAFTTLSWVAGQTSRAALGTAVCIAPYRHPILLAKILGSLAHLTGRTINLGVGTGWLREEFDALGADFRRRHPSTDATIEFVRRAARGDGVVGAPGLAGPREMYLRPQPPAGLAVWIGGSGPLARRRAAALGDVWFPDLHGCSPDQARAGFEEITGLAADLGREDGAVKLAAFLEVHLEPGAVPDPWLTGQQVRGPAGYALEIIGRYREAGMTEVVLAFGGGPARRQEALDSLLGAGLEAVLAAPVPA